jgi:hypothetical protein
MLAFHFIYHFDSVTTTTVLPPPIGISLVIRSSYLKERPKESPRMGPLGAEPSTRERRHARCRAEQSRKLARRPHNFVPRRCVGDSDPRVRGLVPVVLLLKTDDHHLVQRTRLFPLTAPRAGRAARDCKEASAGAAAEGSRHVFPCFHITIFLCERACFA